MSKWPRSRSRPYTMSSSKKRNRQETSKENDEEIVRDINDWDVIMGRESLDSFHTGTVRLMASIDASIPEYKSAASRTSKTRIIKSIYRNVAVHGRFLTRHQTIPDAYTELSEKAAREKISHIIRYRQRNERGTASATAALDPGFPMFAESSPGYVHTSMGNAAANLLSALQPTVPLQLQQQARRFSQLRLPSLPFSVSEREEMDFWASYYSHHQVMTQPSQQLFGKTTSVTEEEIFSDAELMSVLGGFLFTD